jgi:hypothetical protein
VIPAGEGREKTAEAHSTAGEQRQNQIRFAKGTLTDVETIFRNMTGKRVTFGSLIVQPGLSKGQVKRKVLGIGVSIASAS